MGQHVPDPQIPPLGPDGKMDGRVRTDVHPLDGPDEARLDCGQCRNRERALGQARRDLEFEAEDDHDERGEPTSEGESSSKAY